MNLDITSALKGWPKNPTGVAARIITATDNRQYVQLRLELGLLQMRLDGRPDGIRPHGEITYLSYLRQRVAAGEIPKLSTVLPEIEPGDIAPSIAHESDKNLDGQRKKPGEDDFAELHREMMQFYHRRIALLAVASGAQSREMTDQAIEMYTRAVRDANYALRAMNFIAKYCDNEEFVMAHERFRPFVIWHRTLALAQLQLIRDNCDHAVEEIKRGLISIRKAYTRYGAEKMLKHDPSWRALRHLERKIRSAHGVKKTLREQLNEALATEDYERAVELRDELRSRDDQEQ